MAVPTSRRPPLRHGLVASAMKVEPRASTYTQRRGMEWQNQAFMFVKLIPEYNYASRFYAKMLSKLRIFPAFRRSDDQTDPIKSGPPVDLLDRVQDPGGGRSQLLSSYGRLMFIIGDGYLFGHDLDTELEQWKFVSPIELKFADNEILWQPEEGREAKKFRRSSQAEAYRMWTADPERSGEAESPMRAVLEIGEELDALTKTVRSTAVGRRINGMITVPQELSLMVGLAESVDDPEQIPLLRALIEHLTGVVENPGMPEASAPWMVEGPDEFLANLKWSPLRDTQTDYAEKELRKEAIDRSAMGMDLPIEVLKGFSSANHWGARQILHDTWRSHGSVLAEQFCDDLAEAYLRPALREENFSRWKEVVVTYDDSNVIVPPDRTDDADKAHDRGEVNSKGYHFMKGIDESYAATDEDKRVWLAVKLRDVRLLKGTSYEVEETPVDQPEQDPGPTPSGENGQPPEETPPDPGPAGVSRKETRAAIEAAAVMALIRCREWGGARIRSRHKHLEELAVFVAEPNHRVTACLGEKKVRGLGYDPAKLIQGGTDGFCSYLVDTWGFTETQAKALSEMLLVLAAQTIFRKETPALPAGFLMQVERMQDVVERNNAALSQLNRIFPEGSASAVSHREEGRGVVRSQPH